MAVAVTEIVPTRLRRLANFSYTGPHRYLLTTCTYEKRSVFTCRSVVDVVRTQFLVAAQACGFDFIAYCFMPDHVHLVAHGITETSSLPEFMQRAKQRSGYHGKRVGGHSVWQAGYHDRVIRSQGDTAAVVEYVLANPVRAGIAEHPNDYPFSWAKPGHRIGPSPS